MDEKLVDRMRESRMIAAVDNVIFPVLDKMVLDRLERVCGNFRAGKTDHLSDIAYMSALKDLKVTLDQMRTSGDKEFEKLNRDLKL